MPLSRAITLLHTSDLHVDEEYTARLHGGDGTKGLHQVLGLARDRRADAVLIAGDTFENNRLSNDVVQRVHDLVEAAGIMTVILPGNHDPCVRGSIHHALMSKGSRFLRILGVTDAEAIHLPELDLTVFGKAHSTYSDMDPIPPATSYRTSWRVMLAHGHYCPDAEEPSRFRPSWRFGPAAIEGSGAHYVALGHWNSFARVATTPVPAYYSGAPETAGTVNLIRLDAQRGVEMETVPIAQAG